MSTLIALLSSGKGTWAQVNSLVANSNWEKVILVCNDFAFENFDIKKENCQKVKINEKKPMDSMKKLAEFFKTEVNDFEVALNLTSGTGMEHMAVLSSVLKAGLGLRFVCYDFGEIKEFEILDEKFIPSEDEDLSF